MSVFPVDCCVLQRKPGRHLDLSRYYSVAGQQQVVMGRRVGGEITVILPNNRSVSLSESVAVIYQQIVEVGLLSLSSA